LYVPEVEPTAAFYERVFGLARGWVDPAGTYVSVRTGDTVLAFAKADWVAGNGLVFAPVHPQATPPGIELGFVVDDVQAVFSRALEAGATLWLEPARQPWGQTVSFVRDPNGFLVEISSPPPNG
jgi:catechol 2,3-dioxygenase-like lactoylglutathione lyase family enzyme